MSDADERSAHSDEAFAGDFRLLFEASPDVLLVLLPDAPRYTMVAATNARLLATHTTREQTMRRPLFDLFPDNPDDPEATGASNLRASLERVLATRAPDTMAVQKYDIRSPDGTFQAKYWSPKNIPVLSASGDVIYILHRVEDVTDLVRATEVGKVLRDKTRSMEGEVIRRGQELAAANLELRDANSKLGQLDEAKTAFFSNVSHEFRTPLTLILGPTEDALASGSLDGENLRAVHRNALRLLGLVNSLLDFSRIEGGHLQSSFEPVDLPVLTAGLAGAFQSLVEPAGLKLVVDCPRLPEAIYVDPAHWEKIVANLVSNAFKFTFEGEIAVRLRARDGQVELSVSDTGTGIPSQELPKVFERFHRVEGARGRSFEGTGIGLALVHELAKAHGGTVRVESVVGQGSTFFVSIPLGTEHLPQEQIAAVRTAETRTPMHATMAEANKWFESPAGELPDHAHREGHRILLADDNADMREYLVRLLAPHWEVEAASDGEVALASAVSNPPDLVLSDVMMPRMDGVALLRALRADSRTQLVPVVLLSARAGEEAVLEGLDTGADDYLVKPFSARELLTRVRTHLRMGRVRREATEVAKELAELRGSQLRASETRLKNVEEQYRQAQKMEAVGRLAGGVAHDFNNILSVILGYAEMLTEDLKAEEPIRADIAEIRTAALRATDLTRQLLAFSRQQVLEPRVLNLNQSIAGMDKMLGRLLGADVALTMVPQVALWNIKADPGQVEQVVMNLVVNARDAMQGGGKLTVETANVELDEDYARAHHDVRPGPYVMLAVSDTGLGMD